MCRSDGLGLDVLGLFESLHVCFALPASLA